VTDGTRTRDPRDHNPVLYQLSYDHHAHLAVPHNHSGVPPGFVERVTPAREGDPYSLVNSAAIALAASTSGPGSGTKIARR
jgi:hypothetical protein